MTAHDRLILDNPGGFLSNLIAAVKGGFSAFAGRIWDHLKKGFMKWLFGALGNAGIPPGGLVTYLLLPFWLLTASVVIAKRQRVRLKVGG